MSWRRFKVMVGGPGYGLSRTPPWIAHCTPFCAMLTGIDTLFSRASKQPGFGDLARCSSDGIQRLSK